MAILSNDFAKTAKRIFAGSVVPFRKGGKDLKGMDSAGFIEYCLKQHGVNVSFTGTNHLYRTAGAKCVPLKEALEQNLVKPGVLLLHVANDGNEPSKYRSDGKGNCDYAMIAVSSSKGLYPSQIRQKLIETDIRLAAGRANIVMFCKYIDYDEHSIGNSLSLPSSSRSAFTTADLILREGPSKDFKAVKTMPRGSEVNLLERNGDWYYANYYANGLRFEGWCHGDYLTSD